MSELNDLLAAARAASVAGDWPAAARAFEAARSAGQSLSADDEVAFSDAIWWLGDNPATIAAMERAWHAMLAEGRQAEAAIAGLGLAGILFLAHDEGRAAGWLSRAQRLIVDLPEGPAHGYLAYFVDVEAGLAGGDADGVEPAARRVRAIGEASGDSTLIACGLMGEGRARLATGEVADGLALLDEAMLVVAGGSVRPEFAGDLYCQMMATCHELGDVRRARAWTEATWAWVASLPASVMFTGVCRVYRSQLMQLGGAWAEAEAEALLVTRELATINVTSAAEGWYQVGELRRLRGDLAGANAAYRNAHERGREPQPGIALLRLAEGRTEAAAAGLRVALAAAGPRRLNRARLLAAQAEVAVRAGEVNTALEAAHELEEIARAYRSPAFGAAAAHALGIASLAAADREGAIAHLQDAVRRWLDLDAPYEAALARLALAAATEALGDRDAADRNRNAAAAAFARLGAAPAASVATAAAREDERPGGLTGREVEVLNLVATGRSNREVADALGLSDRTVARHLANIFDKLDVASRTEAAAFAFEHGLARQSRPR